MSYFGIPLRNGVGLGLGATTGLRNAAINAGTSLSLDFTQGTLSPNVTFSRTSNATLTGSNGLIQYAPNNLLTFSEQFGNAAWSKSEVTVSINQIIAPDGTLTADKILTTTANNTHVIFKQTIVSTGAITLSVYAKAGEYSWLFMSDTSSPANGANFNLTDGTLGTIGANATAAITSVGNGWYRCTVTTTASAFSGIGLYVQNANNVISFVGNGTSGIYIWGAQLNVGSLQPYYPTTTAAYYGPRFDYDPITLACKGLLIEEQRVNLLTYSEDFSNAAWAKSLATINANAIAAPDGTLTADALVETATGGYHETYRTVAQTIVAGTSYTMSVFCKTLSATRYLNLSGSFGAPTAAFSVRFDPTTNTVSSVYIEGGCIANASVVVSQVSLGFYRVSLSFTGVAPYVTLTPQLALSNTMSAPSANNFGVTAYTGDGTSGIYIWGAQLEAGAFATSYIPTVASQVTRTADNASMTGTNFSSWYNQSEGTLSVTANPTLVPASDSAVRFAAAVFDTTSYPNALRLERISGIYRDVQTVSGVSAVTGNTWNTNSIGKLAGAYANSNNSAVSFNGASATALVANAPLGITQLGIGGNGISGNMWCGHIQSISYYPRRLTNSELIAITT